MLSGFEKKEPSANVIDPDRLGDAEKEQSKLCVCVCVMLDGRLPCNDVMYRAVCLYSSACSKAIYCTEMGKLRRSIRPFPPPIISLNSSTN